MNDSTIITIITLEKPLLDPPTGLLKDKVITFYLIDGCLTLGGCPLIRGEISWAEIGLSANNFVIIEKIERPPIGSKTYLIIEDGQERFILGPVTIKKIKRVRSMETLLKLSEAPI